MSITAATAVMAEPQRLSAETLVELVPGSTISLDTPIGTKIPMRFGRDGIVSGEAGLLGSYLGSAKDRGRWTVENGKLCIKWFRWFDSEQRCMEISAEGDKITWRQDDGDTGTGTVTERGTAATAAKLDTPAKAAPAKMAVQKPKVAVELKVAGLPAAPAVPPPAERARMLAGVAPAAAEAPASAAEVPPAAAAAQPVAILNPLPPAPEAGSATLAAESSPALAAEQLAEPSSPEAASALPGDAAAVPPAEPQPTADAAEPAKPAPKPIATKPASQKPVAAKTAPKPAVPATPSFRVARVEDDDILNVRSAPSEEAKAVGVISSNGRGVRITGTCDGEWCPVRHGGVTGWVNRYYLAQE